MGFRTQLDQERAIQAAQFQQETARGLEQIFSAFPILIQCEANSRLIAEMCRDFMGAEVAPSLDTFRNLIALNPDTMSSLAKRPVERTRELIIEDILALLASKDDGRDGKYTSFNLRSEERRMKSWTLDALKSRLQEIRNKQRMASTMSVSELKQVVKDSRPDYNQWPQLPKTIWNGTAHVPLNAEYIKRLDSFEIRRLQRLYGPQVNERLAQVNPKGEIK